MDLNGVQAVVPARRASLDDWRPGDAWLAGGTWLFSEPQPGVERLLDLGAMDWPAIQCGPDGVELAATCTLAELARWSERDLWPASGLARQCYDALLGSFKVWNSATVGGNVCLALPAGPMISLAVALDAACTIWRPGGATRSISALEFVRGPGQTVLSSGELLRSISLPASALRCRTAFRQGSLSPVGRSAALVIGRCGPGACVFTITASVPAPLQLRFGSLPSAPELWATLAARELTYFDDVHGDPRWRAGLTRLLLGEVRDELAAGGVAP
jgi:CO/xanthine dehydrogenase FAD-binding subunit